MTRAKFSLPQSRVQDPKTAPVLRWGILGTGWIADNFVKALHRDTSQIVHAVGSRNLQSARDFADRLGVARVHGSYEDLVGDPEVDVVYVATPHNYHVEHGLLAIEAGKHVLIEKPLALSGEGVQRLFEAGTRRGVMVQEAFWSFFLPKFDVMRQVIDEGLLGEITTVVADHGELLPPPHRIHDPALAGGAIHDLGVYCIAIAAWAAGAPAQIEATASWVPSGVVGDAAVALKSESGVVSSLSTTMTATTPCRAVIAGSTGRIDTANGFFFPGDFMVTDYATGTGLSWTETNVRHGALYYEAAEVARRVHAGELASPMWTPDMSRWVATTLDSINLRLGIAARQD